MLLTCSGRDSRRHADNLTRNIDNSGHSRPARTFTKSPKTAKVECKPSDPYEVEALSPLGCPLRSAGSHALGAMSPLLTRARSASRAAR